MYKLDGIPFGKTEPCSVTKLPNVSIPFDPANTDYQNFKKEVLAGAELQDADGVAMSQKDAEAFIKELP